MFSERGQRMCCKRHARDSGQRGIIVVHHAREPLGASSGDEPFDFTLNHQRQNLFFAQGQNAQNNRRDGDDRAGEQRPHEKAAFGEKAHHGLEVFRSLEMGELSQSLICVGGKGKIHGHSAVRQGCDQVGRNGRNVRFLK